GAPQDNRNTPTVVHHSDPRFVRIREGARHRTERAPAWMTLYVLVAPGGQASIRLTTRSLACKVEPGRRIIVAIPNTFPRMTDALMRRRARKLHRRGGPKFAR